VDGKICLLGNAKLMEEKDVLIKHDVKEEFQELSGQ